MKMFKCFFLLFCLAASLYAADWDGSMSEPKSTKEIDGKTFYVITCAEELTWFKNQVNKGASEINAVLTNDIHFVDDTSGISTLSWTPIGKDSSAMFNGIFDGAGRTIYGLYSYDGVAGLFGVTGVNAVIRNVSLERMLIEGSIYGGGIVAINGGTVSSCTSGGSVLVSNTSKIDPVTYSGGIVGWNEGKVTGCMNDGDFFVKAYVGDSLYVGGVVGRNEGTVDNCMNRGLLSYDEGNSSIKFFHFGGVVGWNGGEISKCMNSGGGGFCSKSYACGIKYENRFIAGGITSLNAGSVRDCLNLGAFSRKGNSSGLVGSAESSSSLFNSYSAVDSALYGVTERGYGTVTNCYFDYDIFKSTYSSAGVKMHTSDMQSDRFAWILNTTNGTAENSGVWSRDSEDYPIFADSLHKPIYKVVFDDSVETTNRYTNYKGVVVFPENPEPLDGKKFRGWYTDDSVKVKETTVFTKDQTVYAVYCEPSSCPAEPSDAIIANLPSPTWSVTVLGRNFHVHAAPIGKSYALFDLQGKVLAKGRIESSEMAISAPRAGGYIVRIGERSVRMNAR